MCFNKRFRSVIPGLRSVIPAKAGIHILTLLLVATPLHAKALNVVATSSDLATIAQAVGGSHVKVHALVRGSTDLHSIVPKPSMVVQVRNADLLLRIGMYQDGWVNSLIQTARNPKVFPDKMGYLDASTAITALDVPTGNIDGGKGDIHIAGNPHYWISPLNAIKIAGLVYDHLVRLDPTHHTQFLENLNAFKASVTIKMPEWENKMSLLRDTPIVSYHSTWRYFLNDFGLFAVAKLEPIPGVPPTAGRRPSRRRRALNSCKTQLNPLDMPRKSLLPPITTGIWPPHLQLIYKPISSWPPPQ